MKNFLIWIFYWFGKIPLWPIQWIYFRKKVYYEDKKVTNRRLKGAHIIISNHKGLSDFPMSIFLFPFHKLYCLMSELIFGHGGFVSFFTMIIGGVKVDRANFDFGFMDKSSKLLKQKKLLIIYPEGRVSKTEKLFTFHPSYILIALKNHTPIVPIYTDGKYKFRNRCHVVIGKAIHLEDYCQSENPTKEEISSLNELVRNKIRSLEKLCKENVAKDTYNHGFRFKYIFKDFGRLLAFTMNIHFKVKVYNKGPKKENLKIKGGGIIVSNHSSFSDPLVMINTYFRRRIYILTAEIIFDGHPVRSFLLRELGCVRIDRQKNDTDAINKCLDILKAGNLLVIFPSGHLDEYGSMDEFKGGAALMAMMANVPIYPVFLDKRTSKCGRNPVYLGKKIDVEKIRTKEKINRKDLDTVSKMLYDSVLELQKKAHE